MKTITKRVFWIAMGVLFSRAVPGADLSDPNTSTRGLLSKGEIAEEAFATCAARITKEPTNTLITAIGFAPQEAQFVRIRILRAHAGAPCLDEFEVYGPDSENLALASRGGKARVSSLLRGYAIHAVEHLNDGLYGNDHSWIAATDAEEWAQIELLGSATIDRVVFSRDRDGRFTDRQVLEADVLLSSDGNAWQKVGSLARTAQDPRLPGPLLTFPIEELPEPTWDGVIHYAFLRERETWSRMDTKDYLSPLVNDRPARPGGPMYWGHLARLTPLERVIFQFEQMIERLAALGLDVRQETFKLAELRHQAQNASPAASDQLFLNARQAKRLLFFRDPRLAPLERVLFVKRHPLQPSHNYSEHLDSLFASGGGIHLLSVPRDAAGRLNPARAEVLTLFDATAGIARDPVADVEAQNIYFAYRPDRPDVNGWKPYWRLMSMRADGSGLRQLTEGPFHDFDPVALADGGLGFMSTRCRARFLCWEPQTYVLHRMERDGSVLRRLSFANLSEWNPARMLDGRILWTRSEYQDKGADFGHTIWAIRPNGDHPELVFGNNTPYGYGHAREVPDSPEIVCTLISHGDHQGPIALIDVRQGKYDTAAITSITPDTRPQYQMDRSHSETFRDPEPISSDHFLVSHNPGRRSHWSLYVIDRYGNRELLYLDAMISSKRPSPFRARSRPPVLVDSCDPVLAQQGLGQFTVQDVYEGLNSSVDRGRVKYLQVSQEVPAPLEKLSGGEYRSSHPSFQDFYAAPIHLVSGPPRSYTTRTGNAAQPHAFRAGSAVLTESAGVTVTENNGWPSYVAKAILGTVQIAADGSANFTAPAGKVLYFQLLDENFNELQRMRSVVQLQPGEHRSCVGCHEHRAMAPGPHASQAFSSPVQALDAPPWGAEPFDFERVVQPVLNAKCVRCHDGQSESKLDLRGARDMHRIPVSYRSLITGGWVDYFDWSYGSRHLKADPLSFGTLRSRLFSALAQEEHREVALTRDERRAVTAWIDLNCPLWPDYRFRPDR